MSRVQNRGKGRRILTFWRRKQTQKGRFWWVSVLKFSRWHAVRSQWPVGPLMSQWWIIQIAHIRGVSESSFHADYGRICLGRSRSTIKPGFDEIDLSPWQSGSVCILGTVNRTGIIQTSKLISNQIEIDGSNSKTASKFWCEANSLKSLA